MGAGALLGIVVAICVLVLLCRAGDEHVVMPSPESVGKGSGDLIESHLRAGRKIQAIKVYREEHDVGLKEAKDAVERLAEALPAA